MPVSKNLLLVAGILLILAGIAWFVLTRAPAVPGPGVVPGMASTTDGLATSSPAIGTLKPKTLPPELPFTLPEGASAIDGYAFIQNDQVYFRSLTGAAPLAIPHSDAESFKRLSGFMTYPGTAVVNTCGAAPIYAYYGDKKQVYFYQVWRAPTFRSSTVEVIVDAKMQDFSITGLQTATEGNRLFEIGFEKATTTCKLFLSRTTLQ